MTSILEWERQDSKEAIKGIQQGLDDSVRSYSSKQIPEDYPFLWEEF